MGLLTSRARAAVTIDETPPLLRAAFSSSAAFNEAGISAERCTIGRRNELLRAPTEESGEQKRAGRLRWVHQCKLLTSPTELARPASHTLSVGTDFVVVEFFKKFLVKVAVAHSGWISRSSVARRRAGDQ
jgi:hypothetical protein